jgi:hypothetical protein
MARRAHGATIQLSLNMHGFVSDTDEKARDIYAAAHLEVMNRIGRERGWPPQGRPHFDASCGPTGNLIVGGPERVAERIIELHSIFRNTRILIQMAIGTVPHAEQMRAIELMGTQGCAAGACGNWRCVMSLPHIPDPLPGDAAAADALELVIVPRARDIGSFEVRRALPSAQRQMVGPFIFFDQFGPVLMKAGQGMDVRPHPHIGLSTVTWVYRWRDPAPGQPGLRPADQAGRVELDDGGQGHRAFRTHAAHGTRCWPEGLWHPELGGSAEGA